MQYSQLCNIPVLVMGTVQTGSWEGIISLSGISASATDIESSFSDQMASACVTIKMSHRKKKEKDVDSLMSNIRDYSGTFAMHVETFLAWQHCKLLQNILYDTLGECVIIKYIQSFQLPQTGV